ncbi:DUF4931 domain-containing protein [Fictibacillus iocasae]|uniref:DUF4931 domain-containing protein n=1 Tax=Fictibacillus iocasae TaxID=2715437 RepID=A0ABW2NJU0_9BACL
MSTLKETQITFFTDIGAKKPNSIKYKDTACPFCDLSQLEEIVDQDGPIILVMNKFPVLDKAFQTVLIETDECDTELSLYSKEHLYRLITFGMKHWKQLKESGKYKSVMFFKNHGPLSGGTIRHPHMQIVGLEEVDCQYGWHSSQFDGIPIWHGNGVVFNISSEPRAGFYELNVILENGGDLKQFADCIQTGAHFLLHHFHRNCSSYNLFFYEKSGIVYVKIMPRFVTSPLFMGYGIQQVANNISEVAEKIKNIYYS